MAATFVWTVLEMHIADHLVDGHDECVNIVYWQCTGSEEINGATHTSSLVRSTTIPFHPNDTYVLYPNLTEEHVLGWVWEIPSAKDSTLTIKDITEAEVQHAIDNQVVATPLSPPLPWT